MCFSNIFLVPIQWSINVCWISPWVYLLMLFCFVGQVLTILSFYKPECHSVYRARPAATSWMLEFKVKSMVFQLFPQQNGAVFVNCYMESDHKMATEYLSSCPPSPLQSDRGPFPWNIYLDLCVTDLKANWKT